MGDSFSTQSARGIDYLSTHLWVDNWGIAGGNLDEDDAAVAMSAPKADGSSFAFDREWLRTRKAAAAASGSPFVIEEFGAPALNPPAAGSGYRAESLKP